MPKIRVNYDKKLTFIEEGLIYFGYPRNMVEETHFFNVKNGFLSKNDKPLNCTDCNDLFLGLNPASLLESMQYEDLDCFYLDNEPKKAYVMKQGNRIRVCYEET